MNYYKKSERSNLVEQIFVVTSYLAMLARLLQAIFGHLPKKIERSNFEGTDKKTECSTFGTPLKGIHSESTFAVTCEQQQNRL